MGRNRIGVLILGISVCACFGSAHYLAAQQQSPPVHHEMVVAGVHISGYQKITGSLTGIHIIGPGVTIEMGDQPKGVLHRLRADDIQIHNKGNSLSAELSGNIRYTLLQSANNSKIIEGTAERASFKPASHLDEAAISLNQLHISLFQNGAVIADLTARQATASLHDDAVVATGEVHLTAPRTTSNAKLTADKVTWMRSANKVIAAGNVQVHYIGPDGKEVSTHADRLTVDLKDKQFEIE